MFLYKFTPILIEWNFYNGFIFKLLEIEITFNEKLSNPRSLFSINSSSKFLYLELFFIEIPIIPVKIK